MLDNDITLANATDGTSHAFKLVSQSGRSTVRQAADTASSTPFTLSIKFEESVKKGVAYRRGVVRFDRTCSKPTSEYSNEYANAAVYMVFEHPYIMAADSFMKALIEDLTDLLAVAGYQDKLLNGEP